MAEFWLDTSVFIEAANGVLAFDLNPTFWERLETEIQSGRVASPHFVYRELVDLSGRDDDLSRWASRLRSNKLLFVDPDDAVLSTYTQIADYVHTRCDLSEGDRFLNVADPWVIAHAMAGGTVVVSQERSVGSGSKRIKIPNLCSHFSIGCIRTDRLIRELR